MGTAVRVELWSDDHAAGAAAIRSVMDEMHRIDRAMSPFKPDSELSRINRDAAAMPVQISAEMFHLIARSIEFSRLSDGAFDITYASVGCLYDYRLHIKPSDQARKRACAAVGYRNLILDAKARSIRFAREGVRIDLGVSPRVMRSTTPRRSCDAAAFATPSSAPAATAASSATAAAARGRSGFVIRAGPARW